MLPEEKGGHVSAPASNAVRQAATISLTRHDIEREVLPPW